MHNLIRLNCFKTQMMHGGRKHPFPFFKNAGGQTVALTHALLYEQSQLGAAADYLLIK